MQQIRAEISIGGNERAQPDRGCAPSAEEIARGIVTCASNKAEEMVKRKNTASGKRRQASSPHILVRRDNIVLLEQP